MSKSQKILTDASIPILRRQTK